MTELELKLSLPDQIASQAKAAGLLTSESIERLVRQAIRKAASESLPRASYRSRRGPYRMRLEVAISVARIEGSEA